VTSNRSAGFALPVDLAPGSGALSLPASKFLGIAPHSLILLGICRAASACGSATAQSGSRTEVKFPVMLVCQAGITKRPNLLTMAQIFVKIKGDRE
jgi:hypothetical protein